MLLLRSENKKKYVICQFLANLILGTQTMMCLKLAYCCQHRPEIPSEKSIFGVSERNYVKISIQLENMQVENSFNSNVFPEKSSFHCLDTSNATLLGFFCEKRSGFFCDVFLPVFQHLTNYLTSKQFSG